MSITNFLPSPVGESKFLASVSILKLMLRPQWHIVQLQWLGKVYASPTLCLSVSVER